ncbi:MAG TPA: hypothetical protein VGD67_20755 [Pseudonocardiaceae bacterium]
MAGMLLTGGTAAAQGAPIAGDDRATAHLGDPRSCADAGLAGTIAGNIPVLRPGTGRYGAYGRVPAGLAVTGAVVIGGPAYNVYPPGASTGLHAPLPAVGAPPPQISRAFVCVVPEQTTTTTTTTTTTETTTETTTTTGTTSSEEETTTTSAGTTTTSSATVPVTPTTTQAPPGGGDDDLADTGFGGGRNLLLGGGALVLLGAVLVLLARRGRRSVS